MRTTWTLPQRSWALTSSSGSLLFSPRYFLQVSTEFRVFLAFLILFLKSKHLSWFLVTESFYFHSPCVFFGKLGSSDSFLPWPENTCEFHHQKCISEHSLTFLSHLEFLALSSLNHWKAAFLPYLSPPQLSALSSSKF